MSTPLASSLLELAGLGGGAPELTASQSAAPRDWWAWWTVWLGVCILAWLGNPTPASFRTHLTSLSFYTHLRRLSSPSPARAPSTTNSKAPAQSNKAGTTTNTPSHVLSFSNRISLSVRTPPYTLRSYFLFSVVIMSPPPLTPIPSLSTALSSAKAQRAAAAARTKPGQSAAEAEVENGSAKPIATAEQEQEIWVGAFGRWYAWKGIAPAGAGSAEEVEEEERRGRLKRGVVGMEREDDQLVGGDSAPASSIIDTNLPASPHSTAPNTPSSPSDPPVSPISRTGSTTSTSTTNRNPRSTKRVFRAGQRRASPNSLARLRSKAELSANPSTNASSASSVCATPPSGSTGEWDAGGAVGGGTVEGQEAGAKGHPPLPGHFDTRRGSGSDSVKGDGDEGESAEQQEDEDPVLVELKMQVEELKTATVENEARLQDELEVLRGKKKEEDNFRAELKAKTKVLEEQKRVAELHRVEAERELGERRGVERGVKERVERVRGEIGKIEKKDAEVEERKEKKKRDRREREKKLKEDVGRKKEELKGVEEGVGELMEKVRGLEETIEKRREVLMGRRNEMTARSMGFGGYAGGMPAGGMGMAGGAQAFRRTPGPLSAPFGHMHGMPGGPSSRPSSIRSGYGGAQQQYASAPSSPTLAAHPVSPLDDNASYSDAATKFYGGAFAPEPFRPSATLSQQGFLEHRLQHRRAEQLGNLIQPTNLTSTLPSADDIPTSFLPFDFDSHDLRPFPANGTSTRPGSTYSHDVDDGTGSGATRSRPQLALPLQYLDSGLLAGSESPGLEGPLSPMTPHQTSLIPSQLFQMLDEDDEDEFVMPDSPTFGAGNRDEWKGLGLDVSDDLVAHGAGSGKSSAPGSGGAGSKEGSESGSTTARVNRKREESLSPRVLSPISPVSPHSDSASPRPAFMDASATTTVATPFSPWDSTDQMLSHRLSPMEADDLPRAGLSLNPDAKAFAFQPRASPTTALPPGVTLGHGVRSTSSSSSNGGATAASPTTTAFNSVIGPPVKSRMDFSSTNGTTSGHGTTASGSRFDFNWSKSASTSPSVAPASTATATGASSTAWNPFDDLLGPLKKY